MKQEQLNQIASIFEEIGKHLVAAGKEAADLTVTAVYYQALTNMIVGFGCIVLSSLIIYFCVRFMKWAIKQADDDWWFVFMLSGVVSLGVLVIEIRGLYLVQSSILGVLSPKSALVIKILEKFGM